MCVTGTNGTNHVKQIECLSPVAADSSSLDPMQMADIEQH